MSEGSIIKNAANSKRLMSINKNYQNIMVSIHIMDFQRMKSRDEKKSCERMSRSTGDDPVSTLKNKTIWQRLMKRLSLNGKKT